MADANVLRIWRSGDDLLVMAAGFSFELDRATALALAAEISGCYAAPKSTQTLRAPNRRLTPEDRAEIRRLYSDEKLGPAEIGRRFSMKAQAVSTFLFREGVPANHHERSARAKRMHAARRAA